MIKTLIVLMLIPICSYSQTMGFHIPESKEYVITVADNAVYTKDYNSNDNYSESFFYKNRFGEFTYAISIYKILDAETSSNSQNELIERLFIEDCFDCYSVNEEVVDYCSLKGVGWNYSKNEESLVLRGSNIYVKGTYGLYVIIFLTIDDKYELYQKEFKEFLNGTIIL